jgi:hypothetical protein
MLCRIATNANSLRMMSDKIYVDASQPATLQHSGHSVECPTLQEAVIAWRTLPDKDRHQATIQVLGGRYSADEIDRLYHAPKPEWKASFMTAIVNLVSGLAWPFVVALVVWYFRNDLKTALKRVTEVGLTGAKFEPPSPPEQQIPSPPSAVTSQELPALKPNIPAPKPDMQAYIAQIKSFISADQLDPVLQKLKTELATVGTTTAGQFELLLYLTASLTVQLSHERNYNGIFGSQLNLLGPS